MRVAVIGSRNAPAGVEEQIVHCLPAETTEIVSGGAVGIDSAAAVVAKRLGLPCKVFYPDYALFGRRAPLVRNDQIIDYAELVLAFWDGESHGTRYVINRCRKIGKPVQCIPLNPPAANGKEDDI